MNFVGFLVTLANLQSFGSGPLRDISVRVADVGTLANEFKALPQFKLENFKDTGFYRIGDTGVYLSGNVISYLTDGTSTPNGDGLMLTFYYDKAPEKETSNGIDDGTVGFIRSGEFVDELKEYLENQKNSVRNKRSVEPTSSDINKDILGFVHSQEFSQGVKKYLDSLNIYGRKNELSSDIKDIPLSTKQAKENMLNAEAKLTKKFNDVFDNTKIFGRNRK